MNTRNELLETCLARLAAGESLETCLADYPNEADWLRPLLATVNQVNRLPEQQLRASADNAIQQQLRQTARHIAQAKQTSVPPLRQRPFPILEEGMKNISRFLSSWLLRIVVAGAAVALLFIFVTQFTDWVPTLSNPITEPAAEVTTTNLLTDIVGDATIVLEADLSADPGEVPLYRASSEPVPSTPEEALAWAQEFGLPNPEVYRPANEADPSLYVIGSNNQQLSFQNFSYYSDISYINPAVSIISENPISFAEASDIAVNFLQEHDLLPENYEVEPQLGDSDTVYRIVIRPRVEGGLLSGDPSGAALRVTVSPNGEVVHASFGRLALEKIGTTAVISAQQAYEDLLAGRNILGGGYSSLKPTENETRFYEAPPPSWEIGQTVNLLGYLNILVNVQTGAERATLMTSGVSTYELTGRSVAELSNASEPQGTIRVQGTITAQNGPHNWQIAIENVAVAPPFSDSCITGSLTGTGTDAPFQGEDGTNYILPNVPEGIEVGETMQVCLTAPAEPDQALNWFSIMVPGSGQGTSASNIATEQIAVGEGGNTVTERVVVEQVQEIPVTRTIVESGGGSSSSGLEIGTGSTTEQEAPSFIEPTNPYEIGDEVELTGTVSLYRIVTEAGDERLEATFANEGDQGEASYPLTYSLLASQELLEEMAEFHQLHILVYGRIVPEPDEGEILFTASSQQAIEVDSFDRPWPDEVLEQFLGHLSVGELSGQQVLLFTDHATDQQYVISPVDLPPQAYENDPALEEEQLLLAGVVHPTETFGGLPLLERHGTSMASGIAEATDISDVSLHDFNRIPVVNEADLLRRDGLGGIIRGEVVIERVELVYRYQPQPGASGNEIDAVAQLSEPVWEFYGRSADGLEQFTIHVRAVTDN